MDDHPTWIVNECIALFNLGYSIAIATNNNDARQFLAGASFDIVVTDLGRDGTDDNGGVLVREMKAGHPRLPVVVYTVDAANRRRGLLEDGAVAVEDEPSALIGAVLRASQ